MYEPIFFPVSYSIFKLYAKDGALLSPASGLANRLIVRDRLNEWEARRKAEEVMGDNPKNLYVIGYHSLKDAVLNRSHQFTVNPLDLVVAEIDIDQQDMVPLSTQGRVGVFKADLEGLMKLHSHPDTTEELRSFALRNRLDVDVMSVPHAYFK